MPRIRVILVETLGVGLDSALFTCELEVRGDEVSNWLDDRYRVHLDIDNLQEELDDVPTEELNLFNADPYEGIDGTVNAEMIEVNQETLDIYQRMSYEDISAVLDGIEDPKERAFIYDRWRQAQFRGGR